MNQNSQIVSVIWIRCVFIVLVFIVLFATNVAKAQELESLSKNEIDTWSGSSLGIRIDFNSEPPEIVDIYDHVAASSPFVKGDQLLELELLSFPECGVDALASLLSDLQPDSEISARVQRGDEQLQFGVTTFRKELVDISAIFRRLSKNRIIKKRLEDTDRAGFFDDLKTRMADAVNNSQSPRQAAEALNRIIDEVDVSHTAIIPASAGIGFSNKPKGNLGFVLQRHSYANRIGYFVIDRKPGTIGFESEIQLGDEILTVNGVPVERSKRLQLSGHEDRHQLFVIQADIDEVCEIEFLRTPFDDSETVRLVTKADNTTVESVNASKSVIRSGEKQIGYLRFWNLMSMGVNGALASAIREDFVGCDAIVIDLRGRGGIVPAVLALNRTVAKLEKPVVVTIDGLTRSAKEMLAYLLKKQDHVLVVGKRTTGAVTGATVLKLPSGNSIMIPVASAESLRQFIDGEVLEGVGVGPDETVEHFLPFCAGQDRILDHAVKRAAELAIEKKDIAKDLNGEIK